MQINEIPLTGGNQKFRIDLDGTTYTLRTTWRDVAGAIPAPWYQWCHVADRRKRCPGVPGRKYAG